MLSAARGASQAAQVAVHPDLHVIIADQQPVKQDMHLAGMCYAPAVCKLIDNIMSSCNRCQACDAAVRACWLGDDPHSSDICVFVRGIDTRSHALLL